MNKTELNKMLEKKGIRRDDFYFVFQFVNNCNVAPRRNSSKIPKRILLKGTHELCDGCVEDTCVIIEEIRNSVVKEMSRGV